MNVNEEIKQRIKEARGMPMWLQYVVAISTITASFFTPLSVYLLVYPPVPVKVLTQAADDSNATNTVRFSEIISKAGDLETTDEKINFLRNYVGKSVADNGSYSDFFSYNDMNYYVIISVWIGWFQKEEIACKLKGSDQTTRDGLMLLKKGQRVSFVGTFTNSTLNGYYRAVDDCTLLK